MAASLKSPIHLEFHSNWEKQSPKTRYDIAGPNGSLKLVVPTVKTSRSILKDVRIDYRENWPVIHWRSLCAAYNRSPYFEFYADRLEIILNARCEYLVDLNQMALLWMSQAMQLDLSFKATEQYAGEMNLPVHDAKSYPQVFEEKHGFIPGLSALDLLFNKGSEAGVLITS